jgi:3,4-dihydroxy 2-butanone 4-phosphate synthase/GTP cyclohydrolase II
MTMTATMRKGVREALRALCDGEPIIVMDDEDRENEGDLVLAAEHATAQSIAFMVRHTSGYLCVAAPGERLKELQIPLLPGAGDRLGTAYGVAVDSRHGTTTGISARDRARTIRALADPATRPEDLIRPGHVVTLQARSGGVFERRGHTEATVDLMRLAGLTPVGVLCEVVRDDGPTAGIGDLRELATRHGLVMITIAELVAHIASHSATVSREASTRIPTAHGEFVVHGYHDEVDASEHLALVFGCPGADTSPLVRVHSECLTGETFGSQRCDCGEQLDLAMAAIAAEGAGVVVYLRGQEGRGVGLLDKLRAYALQDGGGHDTVTANTALGLPVDAREYRAAAHILRDLGLNRIRLLTNNPAKVSGLADCGITVQQRLPVQVSLSSANTRYLRAKGEKLGHLLAVS